MSAEREFQIEPLVQESIVHNSRKVKSDDEDPDVQYDLLCALVLTIQTLTNLQSLTASLFGVGAGILGLESYSGFLFYIFFSLITTAFFFVFRVTSASLDLRKAGKTVNTFDTSAFYRSPYDFWTGGLMNGLAGYILTWTLFYGLVRA